MTLREWVGDCERSLHFRDVYDMADRLGIDMRESRSYYCNREITALDKQLDLKCMLVMSMFERKFGLDEEFQTYT